MNKNIENKKAIIVLREIYGINNFIQEQCQKYKDADYDVYCPNLINISPFSYEKSSKAYDFLSRTQDLVYIKKLV